VAIKFQEDEHQLVYTISCCVLTIQPRSFNYNGCAHHVHGVLVNQLFLSKSRAFEGSHWDDGIYLDTRVG
jgi:hypothetical protein